MVSKCFPIGDTTTRSCTIEMRSFRDKRTVARATDVRKVRPFAGIGYLTKTVDLLTGSGWSPLRVLERI